MADLIRARSGARTVSPDAVRQWAPQPGDVGELRVKVRQLRGWRTSDGYLYPVPECDHTPTGELVLRPGWRLPFDDPTRAH